MTLQSSFLGLVAGVLALPVGLLVASVLVFVINRRAFGWTLPFEPDPNLLWQTVALALSAALLVTGGGTACLALVAATTGGGVACEIDAGLS